MFWDLGGPYRNRKCRFPLIIHHLCISNYGRQKVTIVITKYENSQLVAAEVGDLTFIDTDWQQSNGNYTPELSQQIEFNSLNARQWQALKTRQRITNPENTAKYNI